MERASEHMEPLEVSVFHLRTGFGAVHDGVAAVQRERVLQFRQPLLSEVVTRVDHPAIRLKHNSKATISKSEWV